MDPRELDGLAVVAVLLTMDAAAPECVRGVARWSNGELNLAGEDGRLVALSRSWAERAVEITEAVLAAAPPSVAALLAGAAYLVPTLPEGDYAFAVTPGWPRRAGAALDDRGA